MELISTIRVIRKVKSNNASVDKKGDENARFVASPSEPLPPPALEKNTRCLNCLYLLLTYILGIGSITLGAVHFHNCPANKDLPIFLIAFGLILMFARFLNCVADWRSISQSETPVDIPRLIVCLNVLFLLGDIASFFFVCVGTFSFWPTTDPDTTNIDNYCNKILYWTSFSGCLVGIITFIVSAVISCYCCCCYKKPN